MTAICRYISKMPKDTTMEKFCIGISSYINDIYRENNVDMEQLKHNPVMRMTASAIVYSRYLRQIWMVGDCQCMVNGVAYDNPKPHEKETAGERAAIIRTAIDNGVSIEELMTDDIGRKAILPKLKEACLLQNILFPVIDGFDIPTDKVKVVDINEGPTEIVLASDGYPILMESLEKSEKELKRLIKHDPLCIKENVATKGLAYGQSSFDDRSYIRFND